jgi:hypothetical protein
MTNTYYVYAHKKPDGDVFYIGKGKGRRAKETRYRTNFWFNVVRKYGYEIVMLAENLSCEAALEKEKQLIAEYKTKVKLVNMTDGGEGMSGYVMPKEVKMKISDSVKGANNGMFKGKILAKNIKTGKELVFVGNKELENFGFSNTHVYKCVNGFRKSHKGYNFTRVTE